MLKSKRNAFRAAQDEKPEKNAQNKENPEEKPEKEPEENPEKEPEKEPEESDFLAEKMKFEAEKELMKQGLPLSFAEILAGESSGETAENVALFKREFLKALEAAMSEKLKGAAPATGRPSEDGDDPFLRGFNN